MIPTQTATRTNYIQFDELPPVAYTLSEAQKTALWFDDWGANVLPLPHGTKHPAWKWGRMNHLRLENDHSPYGLLAAFAGDTGLAMMTGKTSDYVVVFDADSRIGGQYLVQKFAERNIPVFGCWRPSDGRLKIAVRVAERVEVYSIKQGRLAYQIEVCAHNRDKNSSMLTVWPPTRKRLTNGSWEGYEWYNPHYRPAAPPIVSLEQLDFLIDGNGQPVTLEPVQTKPKLTPIVNRNGLHRKTIFWLNQGERFSIGTRHKSAVAAACDLAGNGASLNATRAALDKHAPDLSQKERDGILEWAYSKPRKPGKAFYGNAGDHAQASDYALAWIHAKRWEGKTGNTDLCVALALVERNQQTPSASGCFRASVRELAAMARVGGKAVQRSLQRLTDSNIIKSVGHDKAYGSSLWAWHNDVLKAGAALYQQQIENAVEPKVCETTTIEQRSRYRSDSVVISHTLPKNDAIEVGALGKTGWRVYECLCSAGRALQVPEITEITGLSRFQVMRALDAKSWLMKSKLVEEKKAGKRKAYLAYRVGDTELDERISKPAGTYGKDEKRRVKLAKEQRLNLGAYIVKARLWNDPEYAAAYQQFVEHYSPDKAERLSILLGRVMAKHSKPVEMPLAVAVGAENDYIPQPTTTEQETIITADPLFAEPTALGGVLVPIDTGKTRRRPPEQKSGGA